MIVITMFTTLAIGGKSVNSPDWIVKVYQRNFPVWGVNHYKRIEYCSLSTAML